MSRTSSASDALDSARWNLDDLLNGGAGDGPARVEQLLDEATERSEAFGERYGGNVGEFDTAALREAMEELVAILELATRAGYYAMLRFSADTSEEAAGAMLAHVEERTTAIKTRLLFFELEWLDLEDDRAEELLAGEGLDFARHHLRSERRFRDHKLSEPEEKILAEKVVSSTSAWSRLFTELSGALTVQVEGEDPAPLEQALSRLLSPDRTERKAVAEAVTVALEPGLRTRAYVFNTLLQDKAVEDRLRHYPHWLAERNLNNEASDESVRALVSAVRARYDLPQRWYRLKAELLGVEQLRDYDRSAAVTNADERVEWADARDLVLEAYGSFSPDLGALTRRFFDEGWIDAPMSPGKRPGAFCAATVPAVHPFVMLNYTSRRYDVLVLAHELGHGVHHALGGSQGLLHQHTPLTLAETASVFGETVTFSLLLERAQDPESRLALLAESIEGSIGTVFRQVAMHGFEDRVHTERREQGELAVGRFGELWAETQGELFGDSVEVTDGYRSWWSYIPHFIQSPGYVYAYAYGQLLALSVYKRYLEEGEEFVPRYLEMLSLGGSRSPEELGRVVGVDLADPGFWDSGLALVEEQLDAAAEAARATGRIA